MGFCIHGRNSLSLRALGGKRVDQVLWVSPSTLVQSHAPVRECLEVDAGDMATRPHYHPAREVDVRVLVPFTEVETGEMSS